MTQVRQPVSFVATSEPESALAFYRDVLGLKLLEKSPYALAFSDCGHMFRVQIVGEFSPAAFTAHGWRVTDIEAEVDALASKGVKFLKFDQLDQDAAGVWTTPEGNRIAWFKDPDGNVLSLTEFVAA